MNPFELMVVVFAGLVIVSLLTVFLNEIKGLSGFNDEVALLNLINIHDRGLKLKADFNASYSLGKPVHLLVGSNEVFINNASRVYTGSAIVDCFSDSFTISRGVVNCSRA